MRAGNIRGVEKEAEVKLDTVHVVGLFRLNVPLPAYTISRIARRIVCSGSLPKMPLLVEKSGKLNSAHAARLQSR
jgi:hypothetical protein